jgi:ornithine decarboxylase
MVMAPSCFTADDVYVTNNYFHSNKDPTRIPNHETQDGVNYMTVSRRTVAPTQMVLEELKKRVAGIDMAGCEPGEEDAFYVADMGEIYRQHLRWKMNLGRVKPFYGELLLYRSR